MSKKSIIKSINWRKNFIIRLFCKHEYQYYADTKSLLVSGERRYHICKKCGKYNGSIFLEYEGMGYK
nr:MAG TPA: 30S ribosomal protein S2 [Caudoviricetes sp.]